MSDSDESDWSTDDESGEEEEAEVDLTAPKPIKLKTPVWDAKFHPTEKLVVAGDLNGIIRAWSFDDEGSSAPELQLEGEAHSDSVRGVSFSPSGDRLFTIGTDKQLLISDVKTGKPFLSLQDAFEDSPYCISSTNENVIATGDEGGVVRLFDIRKKNPIDELLIDDGRCEDGINSIYQSTDGKYLLVASGDGTLSTYNCKRRIFLMETESFGTDLCCVIGVKNESKALVTASDGMIQLYNWNEFGHPSDMFPGHTKGDLTACRLNDQVVLTGDVKGAIRAVNILPNRILSDIGVHNRGVPVETLDVFDSCLALSVGIGSDEIRFWNCDNVKPIYEGSSESRKKAKVTQKAAKMKKKNFYSGMSGELDIELNDKVHSSDEENDISEEEEKYNKTEKNENLKSFENNDEKTVVEISDDRKVDKKDFDSPSENQSENISKNIDETVKRKEKTDSSHKHKRRKKNAKPLTK